MRTFTADQKDLLLNYLFRVLSDTKKTRIKQLLKFKNISVNGVVTTRHNHPLLAGDQIVIQTAKKELQIQPPFNVRIVYEDDVIVVANKPSGLLTIATEKIQDRTAIYAINDYLNRKEAAASRHARSSSFGKHKPGKKIFIVHRLDKDTSGLIVFAKNADVKFKMQENWENVQKKYYAVVEGVPKEKSGTVKSYLNENKILRMFSSPRPGPDSKYAVTHYKVLQAGQGYSLLDIDLETGRKHQIRVHLTDIGCPVAGDKDYGSKTNPAGRLALHAYLLAFKHPVTGEKKEFQSDLPLAFKQIFSKQAIPDTKVPAAS